MRPAHVGIGGVVGSGEAQRGQGRVRIWIQTLHA